MSGACQVDFYLLGSEALDANHLACRLAAMAWERGHVIDIVTADAKAARTLDDLLWAFPEGRFIPHQQADTDGQPGPAPVRIRQDEPEGSADVVINMTPQPLAQPQGYRRLLEIVPHRPEERAASRDKFRAYRAAGLQPATHEIN